MSDRSLQILELLPEPCILASVDGIIVAANPAFNRLLQAGSVTGKNLTQLALDPEKISEYLKLCSRNRNFIIGSVAFRVAGEERSFQCEGAALGESDLPHDPVLLLRLKVKASAVKQFTVLNEKIQALSGEIQQRTAAEDAMRDSQIRFRSLVNSVDGIVWECVIEPTQFRFTFVSECAERILGYPVERWLNDPEFWQSKLHPDDRGWAINFCLTETKKKKDHQFEYRMIAADGHVVWLRDLVSVIVEDGRPARLVGVMVDITDVKKSAAALAESEALFRELADAMPQIVFAAQPDGTTDYYNRRWYELTGAMAGVNGDESFLPILHPDDRQKCLERWHHCVRTGEPYEIEYRFRFPQEDKYRWHLGRALPVRNSAGAIIRWFGTCTDIDDQKRAEEKLERAVAERTASLREAIAQLEEFSYSLSHDLRSPVRAMQGYAKILLMDFSDKLDAEARDYLNRIIRAGTRMDKLITDVLRFSHIARSAIDLQPVCLSRLVGEVIEQYPELQPPHAFLEIRQLPPIVGHEPSLTQVFSNLLGNAVKFVPEGVVPHVVVRAEEKNDVVRIWVEDNGIGIPPQYQNKVFGIFERIHTDNRFAGTGIGLAIVRKALERMGGRVGVESDGISGSRFWFELTAAS